MMLFAFAASRAGAQAYDVLIQDLRADEDATRLAAGREIVSLLEQHYAELVPLLAETSDDEDEWVRLAAVQLLAMGAGMSEANARSAADATAALVARLQDPSARVREIAAQAVGFMLPNTPAAAEAPLLQLLSDPGVELRVAAIQSLSRLAAPSPKVVDALARQLRDPNSESVRGNAADALGALQPSPPKVVAALMLALSDPSAFVRQEAIGALSNMGSRARTALGALSLVAEDDEEPLNRRLAASAITRIEAAGQRPD